MALSPGEGINQGNNCSVGAFRVQRSSCTRNALNEKNMRFSPPSGVFYDCFLAVRIFILFNCQNTEDKVYLSRGQCIYLDRIVI